MRLSQYLDKYLDANAERIAGGKKPITPGTYLAYKLRGRAKNYFGKYESALIRALRIMDARRVDSACRRNAYVRADDSTGGRE